VSRIGKKPVTVPSGVSVSVSGSKVEVSGPLGNLELETRPEVDVQFDEGEKAISCSIGESDMNNREIRAYWGMTRSIISNMVTGVKDGFERKLEVSGVGYTANVAGPKLKITCGFANAVEVPIPQGVDVSVDRNTVIIKGPDKQAVGAFAARVRAVRPPEPYNGKGIKYAEEVVRRKVGKQFGA